MANVEIEDDNSVRYERPLLVRIVGILSILAGILFIVIGILSAGIWSTLNETRIAGSLSLGNLPVGSLHMLSYIVIASGIGTALQGWGLLKMKPWAWITITFFLLAIILLVVHGYVSNARATSLDLSAMIVSIFIAGLLLAYFVRKKEYFNLDMLSTKTTLMIIGGLVTYSIISLVVMEMASTTITEWLNEVVLNKRLLSV